jgi:hypothetical protein
MVDNNNRTEIGQLLGSRNISVGAERTQQKKYSNDSRQAKPLLTNDGAVA